MLLDIVHIATGNLIYTILLVLCSLYGAAITLTHKKLTARNQRATRKHTVIPSNMFYIGYIPSIIQNKFKNYKHNTIKETFKFNLLQWLLQVAHIRTIGMVFGTLLANTHKVNVNWLKKKFKKSII